MSDTSTPRSLDPLRLILSLAIVALLAGVVFSDCELFSNLELTQAVHDHLRGPASEPGFPLRAETVAAAVRAEAEALAQGVVGQVTILPAEQVGELVSEITAFYGDADAVRSMLEAATQTYGPQG